MVEKKKRKEKASLNPTARENQLISLAVDLAAKQLKDGTASPSVITHFLKMATQRDQLEQEVLRSQSKLVKAKADSIVNAEDKSGLYTEAIKALRGYGSKNDET